MLARLRGAAVALVLGQLVIKTAATGTFDTWCALNNLVDIL